MDHIMVVHKPFIRPYFLGRWHYGGTFRFPWIYITFRTPMSDDAKRQSPKLQPKKRRLFIASACLLKVSWKCPQHGKWVGIVHVGKQVLFYMFYTYIGIFTVARTSIVVTHNSSMKIHHIQYTKYIQNSTTRTTRTLPVQAFYAEISSCLSCPSCLHMFLVRSTKKWQSGGFWARPALLASTSWFEWKHDITLEKHHGWSW